jgi:hypothetical protein
MKQSFKTILLVVGLLVILLASCIPAVAQSTLKLDLSVLIDNKSIKNKSYNMIITNNTTHITNEYTIKSKHIMDLEFNTEYTITVYADNTNSKTIYLNTNAPEEDWYIITGFILSENKDNNIIAGGIKYNNKLKTFESYKL